MSSRDMSKREFLAACKRRGYIIGGWGGYVQIVTHEGGGGFNVSRWNAGDRLRDQLKYLIAEERKYRANQVDANQRTGYTP